MTQFLFQFTNEPESLWPFLFYGQGKGILIAAQIPWNDIVIVSLAGLVMAFAMIGIFIFKGYWKKRVTNKVKSIQEYGMNLNDLDSMKGTGLLTDEEYDLIKQRQMEKIRQEIEREKQLAAEKQKQTPRLKTKSPAPTPALDGMDPIVAAALAREGSPLKGQLDAKSVEDQLREQIAAQGGGGLDEGQSETIENSQSKPGRHRKARDVDVEALLKNGLITVAEYERIKNAQNKAK